MHNARVFVQGIFSGVLARLDNDRFIFTYDETYKGPPVSLAMPLSKTIYEFNKFPPFFEGLLPEGDMLEALLRKHKIDRKDYFSQLLKVGKDVVGAVSIEEQE